MKPDKHELTYRKFIKAEKRLNEIYKLQRQAPKVPITPYQNGWTLSIVLRDDYNKSKFEIAQKCLNLVSRDTIVKNPKYISEIRRKPALNAVRRYFDGTKRYYSTPYLSSISQYQYDKLNEQEKSFFTLDSFESNRILWGGRKINYYYFDIPLHYLVVKITKRMITHAQELDTLLLQEESELRAILKPYWRTCGGYSYRYDDYWLGKFKKYNKPNIEKLIELE